MAATTWILKWPQNTKNLTLKGWKCSAKAPKLGTIIYLHGVADNRTVAIGVISRFTRRGFDVIAYDSRAHGESEGENCTYGFYEKADLRALIDSVKIDSAKNEPIILMGNSMGAAVALQAADNDSRILGIMAAEVFSDLRTVVRERFPAFLNFFLNIFQSRDFLDRGFAVAEAKAGFVANEVSPELAAKSITAAVLLVHGAEDTETKPAHSQLFFAELNSPTRIILVAGKAHNKSLSDSEVWNDIEKWVDDLVKS